MYLINSLLHLIIIIIIIRGSGVGMGGGSGGFGEMNMAGSCELQRGLRHFSFGGLGEV